MHEHTTTSWRLDVTHRDPGRPPKTTHSTYDAYPSDDERWAREKFERMTIADPWVGGRITLKAVLWRIDSESSWTRTPTPDGDVTVRVTTTRRVREAEWTREGVDGEEVDMSPGDG